MSKQERFTIVLQAKPSKVPAIHRLRRALKVLLRRFGLRCVRIEQHQRKKRTNEL